VRILSILIDPLTRTVAFTWSLWLTGWFLISFLALQPAASAVVPYSEGSLGFAFPGHSSIALSGVYLGEADYDTGAAFSGHTGIGKKQSRLEGSAILQNNALDNRGSAVSVLTLQVKGSLALQKGPVRMTPYITAGVSSINVDVEYLGNRAKDSVYALQTGAGIGFQLAPSVTMDVRYRFFEPSDSLFEAPGMKIDMDYGRHSLLVGIRVRF
jgi:opacity protein-like surface antigen